MSTTRNTRAGPQSPGGGPLPLYATGAHFRVRLIGLLAFGAFCLMVFAARPVFGFSRDGALLILVLGVFIVIPVGLVVWAVRSHLRRSTRQVEPNVSRSPDHDPVHHPHA
jgi:hypothetical protein